MASLPFSAPAIATVSGTLPGGLGLGLLLLLLGGAALGQQPTPAPATLPNSQRLSAPSPLVAPSAPPTPGASATSGAPAVAPSPKAPLSEAAFAALLKQDNLDQLNLACAQILEEGNLTRLRKLQERLLVVRPAPQPLPVVLANAEVLLSCRAPQGALTVLDRYGPGRGAPRVQWLLLQWRAATAALDHRLAALALDRLTGGSEAGLNQLTLPIRRREDGTVVNRSAVEVLAGHLEARGFPEVAAQLLLRQSAPAVPGAERLGRAVALLAELPAVEREAILERALEQAAAAGAWSLVSDLLDAQAALPSARAQGRRLRLSPRLDDAYGEWLLRRDDPTARERARQLEQQLRSPQAPGGHAYPAPQPPPAPPAAAAPRPAPAAPVAPAVPAAPAGAQPVSPLPVLLSP